MAHFRRPTIKPVNDQGHELSRGILVSMSSFVDLRGLCGYRFRKLTHYRIFTPHSALVDKASQSDYYRGP